MRADDLFTADQKICTWAPLHWITGIQGGLATAFDLAAFRLSMIAPVKKSVNHPKTVASMRGTGWENKFALAASSQRFGSVK